ncbi:MAG: hypothetical protein ACYTXT_31315 [Nostoc sp.]
MTFCPTASTTPARSVPSTAGSTGLAWGALPVRILLSSGLTPLALIRTKTCLAVGSGRGISAVRNVAV